MNNRLDVYKIIQFLVKIHLVRVYFFALEF